MMRMLNHYLVLAVKVLLRRKFFTFISLFGISFTLLVLTVVTALFDHAFGPDADRAAAGPHALRRAGGDVRAAQHVVEQRRLQAASTRTRGTCRASSGCRSTEGSSTVYSYLDGRKIASALKRTDDEFWQDPGLHVPGRRRRTARTTSPRRGSSR